MSHAGAMDAAGSHDAWNALLPGRLGATPTLPGIGPMLVWADATEGRCLRRPGDPWPDELPVLVEHADGGIGMLRLRPLDLRRQLQRLSHAEGSRPWRRVELQVPVIPERPRARPVALRVNELQAPRARSGAEVLLGVIDSGCPFAHRMLRNRAGTGTRVLHLWDQDESGSGLAALDGAGRRADLARGCEIDRAGLDRLMARHAAAGRRSAIDEPACYVAAGQWALSGDYSHGAAVLGRLLAAQDGGEPASRRLHEADLVFVQLPRDAAQDSSSASLGACLIEGIDYILSCAGPRTRRVVINISDGTSRTRHDGTSLIECALAQRARPLPGGAEVHIVLAAGNSHDEERHGVLVQGGWLDLRVDPDTESPTFVSFRLPHPGTQLRVTPPAAPAGQWVSAGQAAGWCCGPSNAPMAGLILPAPPDSTRGTEAMLVIAPTAMAAGAAPAGLWRIEMRGAGEVLGWVSRNQTNLGALPRGHQARFVDSDGRYDPQRVLRAAEDDFGSNPVAGIRRRGALNGLVTAQAPGHIWVAGAAYADSRNATIYSSRGLTGATAGNTSQPPWANLLPTPPGSLPHALVRLDRSRNLPGFRATGNYSAAWQLVSGTSFAAPTLARYLAAQPTDAPVAWPPAGARRA